MNGFTHSVLVALTVLVWLVTALLILLVGFCVAVKIYFREKRASLLTLLSRRGRDAGVE